MASVASEKKTLPGICHWRGFQSPVYNIHNRCPQISTAPVSNFCVAKRLVVVVAFARHHKIYHLGGERPTFEKPATSSLETAFLKHISYHPQLKKSPSIKIKLIPRDFYRVNLGWFGDLYGSWFGDFYRVALWIPKSMGGFSGWNFT